MTPQFNKYNNSSHQHIDNTYGELTNSLIYPPPFQPNLQPNLQPEWPTPPGWQTNGSSGYNGGGFYSGGMAGSNGYFPEQQDYVEFDEGDDFYNNGDEVTPTQPTGGPATGPGSSNLINTATRRSSMQRSANLPGVKAPNSKMPEQHNQEQTSDTMPQGDPSIMLGVLRAKLLAKKPGGGNTPTPEPKSDKAGESSESGKGSGSRDDKKQSNYENATTTANKLSTDTVQTDTQKDDKSTVDSKTPPYQQTASGTDIEALFDEARAAEAAKKNKSTTNGDVQGTTKYLNRRASKPTSRPEGIISVPRQVEAPVTSRRPSLANSMVSSETSEQGEIHEELYKSDQSTAKRTSEYGLFKGSTEKPKSTTEGKYPQLPAKPSSAKPEPQKLDTALAIDRKGGSEIGSAKPKSPSSARTPSASRPKDVREDLLHSDPREEYRRDRVHEPLRSNSDRRQDVDWDRPRERRQQNDAFRAPTRYRAEEAERAAAEYKRNLQLAKTESRHVAPASQPVEEPQALSSTKDLENFDDDINEWLEMTGYFDKTYRKKALTRHRKLVELDKQTAELVREGQAEHEERLHIARAQSIRPRESIESPFPRSNITPQGLPSISMPPPPLPMKDVQEDVGIQIKDLANRESAMSNRRIEDDLRAQRQLPNSPITLAPAVKRQYPEDGYGSPPSHHVDKFARTDSREYSFDKKTQPSPTTARPVPASLESRISVDHSPYKREYQARSRSPGSRRRSVTPPYRRTSGSEMQLVRQRSGSSRNGYSPQRRAGMSREASPSRREGGLSYDSPHDNMPHGRYNAYRSEYDNRSNAGYEPYYSSHRGGHYQHQQYQSPNYRGRGRGRGGRGGYYNHNRGSYKAYDRGGSE